MAGPEAALSSIVIFNVTGVVDVVAVVEREKSPGKR
jgi:hypothetical protein